MRLDPSSSSRLRLIADAPTLPLPSVGALHVGMGTLLSQQPGTSALRAGFADGWSRPGNGRNHGVRSRDMTDKSVKRYLFASDFDQTLTFNDSGYVLSEILGIGTDEFERKAAGMAKLNLVQQGAELAYLLLHDPEFRSRVRQEHLYEVGKIIRLKENIELLSKILEWNRRLPIRLLCSVCGSGGGNSVGAGRNAS